MSTILKLMLIATGGAIGALLRFAIAGWTHRLAGLDFPYGTLTVNLLGCLAIGFLWSLSERAAFDPALAAFVFVRLLGSFTTFSTYGLELLNLIRSGNIAGALGYFAFSNVVGIAAVALGYFAGRIGA
ncbi:MAG: fluoride efflux transporter CrcB [Bacteroidota bacterium]